jgi:hypothetical protein
MDFHDGHFRPAKAVMDFHEGLRSAETGVVKSHDWHFRGFLRVFGVAGGLEVSIFIQG